MTLALDRAGPCRYCGATTANREFVAWMREDWVCADGEWEACVERMLAGPVVAPPTDSKKA